MIPRTAADLLAEKVEARRDPTKHVAGAPAGYRLKGVSSLVNAEGEMTQQWIKTTSEIDPLALLDQFRAALDENPIKVAKPTPARKASAYDAGRLTAYPLGDPHFGMLSWPEETGEDFNLQIARDNLAAAIDRLVNLAPVTEEALLINLGDFLHSDNFAGVTARSGHPLDTDSRWPKILRVSVWALIHATKRLLEKHRKVHVVNLKGNHDDQSAIMLALCMATHFDKEPRVVIDESPAMFHWHEFGANLFGMTHGHTVKAKDLPGLMAADKPEAWGRTKFRRWYTGHVHHESAKEFGGCVVETFNTLAAKDAWHHGQGYRARRQMVCDVHDKKHGLVLRHTVGVEAL